MAQFSAVRGEGARRRLGLTFRGGLVAYLFVLPSIVFIVVLGFVYKSATNPRHPEYSYAVSGTAAGKVPPARAFCRILMAAL